MAKLLHRSSISATVTIELTEAEAAALDAIVGYGHKSFLEVFYKHLGKSYLEPYEAGLKSLFDSVRCGPASVGAFLTKLRETRKIWEVPDVH